MAYQIWVFTQSGDKVAVLQNASNIRRKTKMNGAPSLSFSLPADDEKTSYITSANEIKVWNDKKSRFEGLYCLDKSVDRWGSSGKFVDCDYTGAITRLIKEKNISYDTTATPKTATQVITGLLALQQRTPAITIGAIQPTDSFCFAVENTNLLNAFFSLPKLLGGFIEVDEDRHLNWWNEPTGNPTREIRYQKQLKSMTREVDHTNIINRLYAYGYGETEAQVTLKDAGCDEEFIETDPAPTPDELQIDRITDKRITHPSTLLLWAQRVLAEYSSPIYSYQVDIVNLAEHKDFNFDLEEMTIGAIVRVVNSDLIDSLTGDPINVNVKVVSVDTDLSRPEKIYLELANATKSLSDLIGNLNNFKNTAENTAIALGAGQVRILGEFTVDGWRSAGTTTINGGMITANTITTTQLNFTPVTGSNVVASINASSEGITIDADMITISGSCNFASGYDPTSKTAKVGGTYDSAASGARVRIFPDANTGILITDGTNDVFKALVGGTDVGDVIIGDYANNKGAKWDKSAGTFIVRGNLEAVSIASGKTLTVTGAIQSNDYAASPAAGWLLSGSGATLTDANVRGALSVGSTIDATGTVSASGLVSSSTLRLSANISSPAARSLYTDNGLALKWRDKDGTVRTIAFL